ncbi:MAG: M23 family metallopeptidase [Labilithrix sp.]|nr:M23 family metallopeptidase [Labilithrix sp.]
MMRRIASALVVLTSLTVAGAASAEPFTFDPSGALAPDSGRGRDDAKVYAPKMRFPMETGPAYANSQVWGHGGNSGPKGSGQCDEENYSYPWRDNYCESRTWAMPLCPSGTGHQGQDIRGATCEKDVHWVVAAADGAITNVGSYSVYLTTPDGTRFDYLHMSNVAVKEGDEVTRGQRLGKVSNQFGGTPTTVHLHVNIRQNVAGVGMVFVPTYMSLVESYKDLLNPAPPPKEPDDGPAPVTQTPPPKEPASSSEPPPETPPAEAVESGCASAPVSAPGGALALAVGVVLAGALRRRRAARGGAR